MVTNFDSKVGDTFYANTARLRGLFRDDADDAAAAWLHPFHRRSRASGRDKTQRDLRHQTAAGKRLYHDGQGRTHHPDGQRYGHRRAYAGPAPHADEIPDGVGHRRRYGGDRCLQDRTRYQSEDL